MQDSEKADLGTQVPGIGGDGAQRLRRGAEQNTVDRSLVLTGDGGNLFRHGEHDVEILGIEKFRTAILKPFGAGQRLALRAVAIATGVVSVALMAALIALFQMAAERCGSTKLDGCHDASLCCGHRRAMLVSISFSIVAEYVRHLPLRAVHGL